MANFRASMPMAAWWTAVRPTQSCHQKRELLWADWAKQELLEDVPHRQVVFTIPKRLWISFRYDRKLLGQLAGCAWRALKLYFAGYFDGTGGLPECRRLTRLQSARESAGGRSEAIPRPRLRSAEKRIPTLPSASST